MMIKIGNGLVRLYNSDCWITIFHESEMNYSIPTNTCHIILNCYFTDTFMAAALSWNIIIGIAVGTEFVPIFIII